MDSLARTRSLPSYRTDQAFFARLSIVIAIVTVLCFVQLVLRGLVDPRAAPIWVHLHAITMVGWLGLFALQNRTATRNLTLHRRLGRAGAVLAVVIVPLGWFTVVRALQLHRHLPGYNLGFFLAQTSIESVAFVGLVVAAFKLVRDTQWHRRLMLGATVVAAINPALSRVFPAADSGG